MRKKCNFWWSRSLISGVFGSQASVFHLSVCAGCGGKSVRAGVTRGVSSILAAGSRNGAPVRCLAVRLDTLNNTNPQWEEGGTVIGGKK